MIRVFLLIMSGQGNPVGFEILTERGHQFIAYYDADRQLTVIGR